MNCPRDDDYALWLELLEVKASGRLLDALGDFLRDYLHSSGRKLYVLGLSGGIDSSFLAALLHSRGIPYLGFVLPISTNSPEEIDRGRRVCEAYVNLPGHLRLSCLHDFSAVYGRISSAFSDICGSSSALTYSDRKSVV